VAGTCCDARRREEEDDETVSDTNVKSRRVMMNDFRRQWAEIGADVLRATERVGESGWYILGDEVKAFETNLANTIGRKHVIGCASGLDAIEIGLRALGIKTGDRVLTTALSAFATTLAIVRSGGIPVFADVDVYGLIDLDRCRRVLERDSSIRFLVPVHLYGHALDLNQLSEIKRRFEVGVIEDACQAIGASSGEIPVGSVGDASALSFYPTKNLGALGDAGAIVTDVPEVDAMSRILRDYGQSAKYQHSVLGLNSRLDELHAGLLNTALLPRLAHWTERRRAIAQSYVERIDNRAVRVLGAPKGSKSVWHLFPVLVAAEARKHFLDHMAAVAIGTAIHYPEAISRQSALSSVAFECSDPLTQTERFCQTEVTLPNHPYMDDADVDRVIDAVNRWKEP
jgi:dTDP-3-amino-3,4,6-trideoxy-alpha-D-glucose transaminase